MKVLISPSLLAADFAVLGDQLDKVKKAGADMLHLDVMDGNFVPNITFGMPVLQSLRKISDLYFDVHIMIQEPLRYIDDLKASGAQMITFHYEADGDVGETIAKIKSAGMKAGLALRPGTPGEVVFPYLKDLDMVLVMTVEPGFGGQKFRPEMLDKIALVREEANRQGLGEMIVQVDGGINADTIRLCAQKGADCFVAGSAVFGKEDFAKAIADLRLAAQ